MFSWCAFMLDRNGRLVALEQGRSVLPVQTPPMNETAEIASVPLAARLLLAAMPLAPLAFVLQKVVESVARRQPSLFVRLDRYSEKAFLVDPTDLPFVFRLLPRAIQPTIETLRRHDESVWDVRIAGPVGALVAMIQGAVDGDALFFSRTIIVEGDTEAVLALRNALDDAEIDLIAETAIALGIASEMAQCFARSLSPVAARLTRPAPTRANGA